MVALIPKKSISPDMTDDTELAAEIANRISGDTASRDRANHIGEQLSSTISDFRQAALDSVLDSIPKLLEYPSDPVAVAGDTWVLRTALSSPVGLLLAITKQNVIYKFSFKAQDGSIVRSILN